MFKLGHIGLGTKWNFFWFTLSTFLETMAWESSHCRQSIRTLAEPVTVPVRWSFKSRLSSILQESLFAWAGTDAFLIPVMAHRFKHRAAYNPARVPSYRFRVSSSVLSIHSFWYRCVLRLNSPHLNQHPFSSVVGKRWWGSCAVELGSVTSAPIAR